MKQNIFRILGFTETASLLILRSSFHTNVFSVVLIWIIISYYPKEITPISKINFFFFTFRKYKISVQCKIKQNHVISSKYKEKISETIEFNLIFQFESSACKDQINELLMATKTVTSQFICIVQSSTSNKAITLSINGKVSGSKVPISYSFPSN